MLTRVNELNAILKIVAVVVLLVGGVVGVLIALDVFGGDELVLEIESIGTSQENASGSAEVIPGQEIEVTGKNLDLISNIFLKGLLGQSPIPVLLTPVNKTRLVITVPDSTQFGDYDIEFKDSEGELIAVLQLMVVSEIEFARGPGRATPTPVTGAANPPPTDTAGATPSSTSTTATSPSPSGLAATSH